MNGNWICWTLIDHNCKNYSAITNSDTLQFTTACTKPSQSAVSSSPMDVTLILGSCPCRLVAISHQPPTLLTAISRLPCNGSWSLLYSLGTNLTENTTSNSYSTLACYTAFTWQWRFLWFHSSCFEQICHSMNAVFSPSLSIPIMLQISVHKSKFKSPGP
jgi:hypothetical protein